MGGQSSRTVYRLGELEPSFVAKLLAGHKGVIRRAAEAVREQCIGRDGRTPSVNAVEIALRRTLENGGPTHRGAYILGSNDEVEKLNQIRNALDEAGIPISEIGRIQSVKIRSGFHEGLTKGPDDEPVVTRLSSKNIGITLSPKWEEGPEWPVVQPAAPVKVKCNHTRPKVHTGLRTIVVLSDTQIGFLRDIEDPSRLVPMHDNAAIAVALEVVADLQPNRLVYVGDFLDLPEMSRWLQLEEFWRTTQPAIDEGHRILAQFEAAAGEGRERTQFIAGNHDRRLREYVVKNARAAYHLRPAMATPDDWPDLTVPRLLRFDDLDIDYCGEYPGGEYWITDELVVRHNPESRGAYDASVIAGHTHRITRQPDTSRGREGRKTRTRYEIGCLCSLENYRDERSLTATRVPSGRGFVRDWEQGFAVVTVAPDGEHTVDQIKIKDGRAIYRGVLYGGQKTTTAAEIPVGRGDLEKGSRGRR